MCNNFQHATFPHSSNGRTREVFKENRHIINPHFNESTNHILFNKRDPKLLQQEPCNGAETDSWVKFGKETIAGAHRRPKWVPRYGAQADSGSAQACSGSARAWLTLGSGILRHAQVKAAVAHIRRLKRNQRKGKLILSIWALGKLRCR